MNNQVKLIDAYKQKIYIQKQIKLHSNKENDLYAQRVITGLSILYRLSKRGEFAPDLDPTIKPGDRAIHSDLGQVRICSDPMISVLKDKTEYEVYLSDLEVVE